jgi:hypothetical protein
MRVCFDVLTTCVRQCVAVVSFATGWLIARHLAVRQINAVMMENAIVADALNEAAKEVEQLKQVRRTG